MRSRLTLRACLRVNVCIDGVCPHGLQRVWVTLLEKEADVHAPKLFNWVEVNYWNPSLPLTQEFLKLHNTVPCGRFEGEELRESLPMCYWIDERWKHNPLQPSSEEGRTQMKALIEKYTGSSGPHSIIPHLYKITFAQQATEIAIHATALLEALAELSVDLTASGGPYLLGEQFTLADIALLPFIDRVVHTVGYYKKFVVPRTPAYEAFHRWRDAYTSRESYKVTHADRLQRSIDVQPFGEVKREEYLFEVSEGFANDVALEQREQLANAPAGKRTFDLQAALAAKAAKKKSAE